jgi:hypothetical protein
MANGWVLADSINFTPVGPSGSIQHRHTGSTLSGSENYKYVTAPTAAEEDTVNLTGTLAGGFVGYMLDGNRPIINKNAYVLDGYYSLVYGPITIENGVTVTVGNGADVKVVDWSDY